MDVLGEELDKFVPEQRDMGVEPVTGCMTLVQGPAGCGKTTVIVAVIGLLTALRDCGLWYDEGHHSLV